MKKRYYAIDMIRGFTIISMIIYHTMWDLIYMYGVRCNWYDSLIGHIWQQSIVWSFVFISGFCYSLVSNKIKQGIKIILGSIIITVVTIIFVPEQRIICGVLTMLGSMVIIVKFIEKGLDKCKDTIGMYLSFVLFICTLHISDGYIGIGDLYRIELPRQIYRNMLTTYLGFPYDKFWSTDYFGVFPWLFLYITGFYIYKICKRKKKLEILSKIRIPIIEKIGQYSIYIYMVHQVIIYLVLSLVFYIKNVI